MNLRQAFASVMLLVGATVPATANMGSLEPYQLLRTLQLVQDQIASGDNAAMPMQRKLMALLDGQFRNSAQEALNGKKNIDAFLIYAMSGGDPKTVAAVLPWLAEHETEEKIARGTLHYLRGQAGTAVEILRDIDPINVANDVGAHLALVRGSLTNDSEVDELVRNLNYARLLAPGTLIEEAALRRLLVLYGRSGDAAGFVRISEVYARRFLRSPFAEQFADVFVKGIVDMDNQIFEDDIRDITATIPQNYKKALYMRLARLATLKGNTKLLSRTLDVLADRAGDAGETRQAVDERSKLYSAIASIGEAGDASLKQELLDIDASALPKEDRALLAASLALYDAIVSPSANQGTSHEAAPEPDEPAATPGKSGGKRKKIRTVYPDGRNLSAQPEPHERRRPEKRSPPRVERNATRASSVPAAEPEESDDIEGFLADIRGRLNAEDSKDAETSQ